MSGEILPQTHELSPRTEASYDCPSCETALQATGWLMPGMRALAALTCPNCGRQFYGDLPSGNAVHSPCLLDADTGQVLQHGTEAPWFAKWLRQSYAARKDEPVAVSLDGNADPDRPAILNCLDYLYGHALLKIFNVQQFSERIDRDVIVLVQPNLRWLVPDSVATVLTVDLPLSRGYEWNDALTRCVRDVVGDAETVQLCRADPHPHPETFDIEAYTGVEPMVAESELWADPPTVTFVWRDDRFWSSLPPWTIVDDWLNNRLPVSVHRSRLGGQLGEVYDATIRRHQRRRVVKLEAALSSRLDSLDFAVAGIAEPGGLPDHVDDLRVPAPDTADERRLCKRYATSNVVVGVHGSNMLLPSAQAGATVDLLARRRWGNFLQDVLPREGGPYDSVYHYRMLPLSTGVDDLAACVASLVSDHDSFRQTLSGR